MVDPHLIRGLDADGVARRREDLGDPDVADDNVVLVQDAKTDAVEGCTNGVRVGQDARGRVGYEHVQDPAAPRTVVLEPIRTTASPVMFPAG